MGGFKQRVRSRPSHLILRDARCDKCVMQRRKKGSVIGGGMGGGGGGGVSQQVMKAQQKIKME